MYQQDQQMPEPGAPVLVEVTLGTVFVPAGAVVRLLPPSAPGAEARLVYLDRQGRR